MLAATFQGTFQLEVCWFPETALILLLARFSLWSRPVRMHPQKRRLRFGLHATKFKVLFYHAAIANVKHECRVTKSLECLSSALDTQSRGHFNHQSSVEDKVQPRTTHTVMEKVC